jgi:hypothetical protein
MRYLTKKQFSLPWARVTGTARMPLCLTALVTGILLSIMPLLTGCGEGETGPGGATAALAWSPVPDPSVSAYVIHYGRQSPNQSGSCAYESSVFVDSPSVTVPDLEPNTLYYFAVSAYNGLESSCSPEISTVTPPPSVTAPPSDTPPPSV